LGRIKESALCRQLGVRYVHVAPDLLPRRVVPDSRPRAIDRLLAVLDDPTVYPVLIHCRAGLHRTGVMTAVYRMEYEGWSCSPPPPRMTISRSMFSPTGLECARWFRRASRGRQLPGNGTSERTPA
jgi:hypothetical protein